MQNLKNTLKIQSFLLPNSQGLVMNQEEAEERATRIMNMRDRIVKSLPDNANTLEVIMAGLTVFYQATLHMTNDDQEDTDKILSDCMFLARQIYEYEEGSKSTIH